MITIVKKVLTIYIILFIYNLGITILNKEKHAEFKYIIVSNKNIYKNYNRGLLINV
jgi:hypothetical protein